MATPAPATATPRKTPPLLAAVLLAASLAYPLVVYLALGHVSPRWIALLLVALALARAAVTRESFWLVAAALAGVLAIASALGDQWGPLKLYPALVNLVLFGLFATSLWRGPSVVERLARLREPLGDRQRLAAGARGVDDQLHRLAIQRRERRRARGRQRGTRERARQVAQRAVADLAQAGDGVVLHVARHDHRLAGVPGAEQRGGEFEAVLDEQRPARAGLRGEQVTPRADLAREIRCRQWFAATPRHRRRGRPGARQVRQRPPAGRVSHAALRGPQPARRCGRARAGAPAIRRPSAGPSRRTTAVRCTRPRRPRWPTAPCPRRPGR